MYSEIVGNAITCSENNALGPPMCCRALAEARVLSPPPRARGEELPACRHLFSVCRDCAAAPQVHLFQYTPPCTAYNCSPPQPLLAQPLRWAHQSSSRAVAAVYEWCGRVALPGLLGCCSRVENWMICLESSEHLSPAALWSGRNSSARRDPGVSWEEMTWKQFV